jgi:hypothetical protein
MLKRIFGLKSEKGIEEQGKFHDEEHHNLYSLPNILQRSNQWG